MKSLLFTCALMLAAPAAFPSTQQTPPGIPDALRIQAQDPAGAAKILEDVTTREPKNGRAWRLLGVALQQSKEPDRAIEASVLYTSGPTLHRLPGALLHAYMPAAVPVGG